MSTIKVNRIENTSTTDGGVSIDVDGHVTIDGQQLPTAGPLSNRNLIINGAMQVAQRGTTGTQTQYGGYPTCDRWHVQLDNASQSTFTKETSGGPDGFTNFFKWNVDSADASVAAASNVYLDQRLEGFDLQRLGYGTSAAKPLTISFYVKGSRTGTYVLELDNRNSSRHVGQTYTIDAADTWEYKTITFPADTTGTFNDDNGESLRIKWWLQAGTNFTTGTLPTSWAAQSNVNNAAGQSINLQDTAGSNWNITGVQLEVGSKATPFEHESYGQTLAKCMRYYYRWVASTSYGRFASGLVINSTQTRVIYNLPVPMRIPPTSINPQGPFIHYDGTTAQPLNNLTIEQNNTHSVSFNSGSASGGLITGRAALVGANNSATTYIGISAEL
jgi:hypothetical protein